MAENVSAPADAAGTPLPAPAPAPEAVTERPKSKEDAIARIKAMIEPAKAPDPQGANPAEATPLAKPVPEPVKAPVQASPAEPAAGGEDAQPSETEAADEAPPKSLVEIAERFGVDPGELASELRAELRLPDGTTAEVSLEEAMKGYLRESDYSHKTMALAEERKQFQQLTQRAVTELQTKHQRLEDSLKSVEGLIGGPPDVAMLDPSSPNYNPDQYHLLNGRFQQLTAHLNKARGEIESTRQQDMERQRQAFLNYRAEQYQKLQLTVPEFKSVEKLAAFEKEAEDRLTKVYRFSPDEVKGFFNAYDHRQVQILRDAFAYRRLEEGKGETAKKLREVPKKLRPGTSGDAPSKDAEKVAARKQLFTGRNRSERKSAAINWIKKAQL